MTELNQVERQLSEEGVEPSMVTTLGTEKDEEALAVGYDGEGAVRATYREEGELDYEKV